MTRVALPAAIVLVMVAGMLAVSGWNRSGTPPLSVTLTERELPLVGGGGDEGAGADLRIEMAPRYDPLDAQNWLPESTLRAIGFPFNVGAGAPTAAEVYRNVPPRLAWIVLEYNGPAWRDLERRRALTEPQAEERTREMSRLVPIAAGVDAEELRARYGANHLVVRGVVGLNYLPASAGGPLLYGTLRQLIPDRVAIDSTMHDGLTAAARAAGTPPRYDVDLAVGHLGLPYVRGLRPARE